MQMDDTNNSGIDAMYEHTPTPEVIEAVQSRIDALHESV